MSVRASPKYATESTQSFRAPVGCYPRNISRLYLAQAGYELESYYRVLQEDSDIPLNNRPTPTIDPAQMPLSATLRKGFVLYRGQSLSSPEILGMVAALSAFCHPPWPEVATQN